MTAFAHQVNTKILNGLTLKLNKGFSLLVIVIVN